MLSLAAYRVELGIGYSFALLVRGIFFAEKYSPPRWPTVLSYVISCLTLVSSNLLAIALGFCITLFLSLVPCDKKAPRRTDWLILAIYLVPMLGTLTCALSMYLHDCGSFALDPEHHVRGATLDLFCIVGIMRLGMFPFHGYVLRRLRVRGKIAIFEMLSPLTFFLPLCIAGSAEVIPNTNGESVYLLEIGIALSVYFALASFKSSGFYQYLFYIFASIVTIALASLPTMGPELVGASVYFYVSMVVSLVGLVTCLEFFSLRYGFSQIEKMMGLLQVNRGVGLLSLFFIFTLANMPLALSFLGEDLMLNQIYLLNPACGIGAIISFSFISISLFRFYLDVFGGVKKNYPLFPPLTRERVAFGLLLATGIALPFLPLFYG
jgi:energy-converting hydrogenase Eha subunit A